MTRIAVVIVTHNSECCLGRCLAGLSEQQEEVECILVDAGSSQTAYLDGLATRPGTQLIRTTNIGFAAANNLGYRAIPEETECVVFLNPDAFLEPGTLDRARAILAAHPRVGCLSGLLLGWDLEADRPSGRIDSTGIFRRWYGRWYDRGQGEVFSGQYDRTEVVPAACGAFLFCRRSALDGTALDGGAVFAPEFFLYKETSNSACACAEAAGPSSTTPASTCTTAAAGSASAAACRTHCGSRPRPTRSASTAVTPRPTSSGPWPSTCWYGGRGYDRSDNRHQAKGLGDHPHPERSPLAGRSAHPAA